jgi:hypothetical protein
MQRITFANTEIYGRPYGHGDVKITKAAFKKILKRDIEIVVNFNHDDHGEKHKTFQASEVEEYLEPEYDPVLLYYKKAENTIRFSPHRNLSFTIKEKENAEAGQISQTC